MALEDVDLPNGIKVDSEVFGIDKAFKGAYWYKNAYRKMKDYTTFTSENFGEGKNNTKKMVARWKANGTAEGSDANYGVGTETDIWGQIGAPSNLDDIVWFVPSKAEWNAFGGELGITMVNYFKEFKLAPCYWLSTQNAVDTAIMANLHWGFIYFSDVDGSVPVRLSATF